MLDYSNILEQLTDGCVVKTRNNPVGDYTEWLVHKAYGGDLKGKSTKGYDLESDRKKYQIKGRWLSKSTSSKQLSIIRGLGEKRFDYLIGVYFDKEFNVEEAWEIPHCVIKRHKPHYSESQGGHILYLQGDILRRKGVKDITECLTRVFQVQT